MADSAAVPQVNPLWKVVLDTVGTSPQKDVTGPMEVAGFTFPVIPEGVPTTIIPVAFPLWSNYTAGKAGPSPQNLLGEDAQVLAVFALAILVWALPLVLINRKLCCVCFQRWLSRRIAGYFIFGLIFNLTIIGLVLAHDPDISANDLFFMLVALLEFLSDKFLDVLTQVTIVGGIFLAWVFRRKVMALLGFDHQIIRADLKDVLTCFTMGRFQPIEVALWKAEGLPTGFSTRTIFARVVLGFNEAQHSRPHQGSTTAVVFKEHMHLNYDPEDNTQTLSIVIKQQEVVGEAVSQLAPATGAIAGALGGLLTPLGPAVGAGLGIVTGIGAANSLGIEVARLDLSSSQINRFRGASLTQGRANLRATATSAQSWSREVFMQVDLVPQGSLWFRITDLDPDQEV
ncbi:unnamed protein product [Polarella glacialis]|uniref:Uncharacterized protein n=1 Tax=Polarella glacialis TaxID=89957 RepID=A0A813J3V8_POLGL|nr:unnamed protein product [Polarella glacialis]|eukprot:CAMPEP_0115099644 /NCGR_PEP_ID=MMETSP0227-20121206/32002_1 /TAXON_ID=89957 /ORGANISM="Polarella glacialis, Strain CCMP 1383" /LENGTH=399 /DNA_ID=CAMNT_0002494729 /DNA_START=125 /DNA_END=1324 /DNA_ORIENTATION=-